MTTPRILIVSLGGTITMTSSGAGGITPTLTADKLIDSVPQLAEVATLEAVTQFSMPGASLSLRNLGEVADLLSQTEKAHEGCQIGSYPFWREGKGGANFVIRSTDQALLDACAAVLVDGLTAIGRASVPGGI